MKGEKRSYVRMRNARKQFKTSEDKGRGLRTWIRTTRFGKDAHGKLGRIATGPHP